MRTPDASRVLIVAYDFPPIDSAGMQRVVSMAKYLIRHRWQVTVVTVRSSYVPRQSQATLDLIPEGVEVERTRSFELRRAITSLRRWAHGDHADPFGGDAVRGTGSARALLIRPLVKVLSALDNWTGFPDKKAGWRLPLFLRLWRLTGRTRYDVVLSSSPPHSLHVPVLWLRRLRRFRWIADFRDPWTTPLEGRRMSGRLRRARALERRVLYSADAVVANTPGNRVAILETFPGIDPDKVVVITNGFDTERQPESGGRNLPELTADLVYTGFVYPGMLDTYIAAVRHLVREGREAPRLQIFGPRPGRLVLDDEIAPYVSIHESVPYEACLDIMRRSRAVLLLVPYERETCVPSKLYPYLFCGRPILALAPDGDAADIIEETGTGRVIRTRDATEVAREIEAFLQEPSKRTGRDTITRYAWDSLGSRLATVVEGGGGQ